MTFLRAIPCPAVSARRSFSAKMGALATEDAPCARRIFQARRSFSEGGCSRRLLKMCGSTRLSRVSESEALESGMPEKRQEFVEQGAELYERCNL
jgi:hypothetical protein